MDKTPRKRHKAHDVKHLHVDTSTPNATTKVDPHDDTVVDHVAVEFMSARGTFLLMMAFLVFAAFVLFVLTDMTYHHPRSFFTDVMQEDVQTAAIWFLVVAIPLTSASAWFPESIITHDLGLHPSAAAPPMTPVSTASTPRNLSFMGKIALRFRRNPNFTIYQTVGWGLYALFVTALLVCSSESLPFCRLGFRSNLAVAAFMAEMLIISSVLALERRRNRNRKARRDRFVVSLNNFNNMLLLVGATILAVSSEYTRHQGGEGAFRYALSTGIGSLTLFVTALFNTYGLGGLLSTKEGWTFYQPFTGGAKFIFFQTVSWTCFGAGVFLQGLYLLSILVVEMELFVGAMAVAGALFIVAEIVMMMSLLVFRSSSASPRSRVNNEDSERPLSVQDQPAPHPIASFRDRVHAFAEECLGALIIGVLANLQWVPSALFFVLYGITTSLSPGGIMFYSLMTTFVEFLMVVSRSIAIHFYSQDTKKGLAVSPYHVKYALPRVITGIIPGIITYHHYINNLDGLIPVAGLTVFVYIYEFTYRGNPQHTGCRMKKHWLTDRSRIIDVVEKYFDGKLIRTVPLDPNEHYIMSFHPHGIMPTSIMWLQFNDQWKTLFPNIHAHILTASVLHQIPLARDVLQFFGSREVTRQAFVSTLQEKESVLLVPGGQAEMLEQQSNQKEVRVHTHHKGFIRLAIEHGVPLVPILSFKEGETMDNIRAPMVQRWFVKKLAFPFPYFPYGRLLLPIPRKTNITIAIGAPLRVQQITSPTAEDIDRVHAKYFDALKEMFEQHKDEAGCGDYKLVLL